MQFSQSSGGGLAPALQVAAKQHWSHVCNQIKETLLSHTGPVELVSGGKTYRQRSPSADEGSGRMHVEILQFLRRFWDKRKQKRCMRFTRATQTK